MEVRRLHCICYIILFIDIPTADAQHPATNWQRSPRFGCVVTRYRILYVETIIIRIIIIYIYTPYITLYYILLVHEYQLYININKY